MAEAFFVNTDIIGCEIIREKNGIPMSTRNLRLSDKGKEIAGVWSKTLK